MDELESLRKWKNSIGMLYEHKKKILLTVHARQNDIKKQTKLVTEINILAQILNEDMVNEENIAASLRVYPDKYKV